ncbi:efflux RND transporter periplasmic adaptor subunit [Longimicrobium sp.]|uniref:efflux RND transporter periplasmic adaptor subunit n=1 Tax=Longimicrobium sp. TaxID=2029185 RepID=UPI002BA2AF91|nr:efflux RND transporter periplasmic adaptor subunit [Longimicrobium sp.]HSU13264.1 efflux RND transporter periplasmic adaptor subunit [Longimicrobium sp.]
MKGYRGMRWTVLALLVGWSAASAACGKKGEGQAGAGGRGRGGPPTAVRVAVARIIDAPVTVTASGVVDPMQTVAVQSQVSGTLQSVEFTEGSFVRPGQVLFRIDPRPLMAAAAQARAALARDEAQAEAARRNDTRYQTLVRQDYVAREEADQVHAAALAASATVEADRAALAAAEVNLSYATIRAPIAGKTGAMLVRAGNLVGPSTGPLVVINQLSPVQVRFPVLSQDLPLLQSAVAQRALEVTAVRSDSGAVTETGTLSFLDNSVDSLTGTVTGKAIFQNRGGFFWPGQLVFLTVNVGVQRGVLAIPSAAILTGQQGSYVYVVNPQTKTVASRNVVAGRTVGELAIISAGLGDGEMVVTDGQARLKPGGKVAIVTGDGSENGPGSVAGGGPPGTSDGPDGAVAAGSTGGGARGGGEAAGGAPAGGGGQPGSVTAGVQGARTNGAAGQTGVARTGGGASVANAGAPATTPTGARSGTGNGSAPVASPLPAPVRGVTGGARPAGGASSGVTGGTAGGGAAGTPAGGGARP